MNIINDSDTLGLEQIDLEYFRLLIYTLTIKMLKMISNKRQNSYKFSKWDLFRDSEKYRAGVTLIFSFLNRI